MALDTVTVNIIAAYVPFVMMGFGHHPYHHWSGFVDLVIIATTIIICVSVARAGTFSRHHGHLEAWCGLGSLLRGAEERAFEDRLLEVSA